VRDISVVSEEEYAAFRPPERVAKLPDDFTHPHLEYSGLYESGWAGKQFKVRLWQPGPGHEAVVRGMVPQIGADGAGFRTEVTVLIDGVESARQTLKPGDFEVRVPTEGAAAARWVECRFSHAQRLPAPDNRTATALVRFVGFETAKQGR
jgi:hypothetical protein